MKTILLVIFIMFVSLSAFATTKGYRLQWDPNSEPDLAGYRVYIGTQSGGPYTVVAELGLVAQYDGELNVPDDALSSFYWVVTAFDTSGLESDYSNEVGKTFDTRVPPTAPKNLTWFERLLAWIKNLLHWS